MTLDQDCKESAIVNYAKLDELIRGLSPSSQTEVRELWAQAIGYVWGRQDASGDPRDRDSDASWRFGLAYATHAARYAARQRASRYAIQDVYRAWIGGRNPEELFAPRETA